MEPVLLVRMSSGAEWEDPSEDLLFELLADIDRGEESFLMIERLDEPGRPLVRVARTRDGRWVGDRDPRRRESWDDLRDAHEWLMRWAFRIDDAPTESRTPAFGFGAIVKAERAMRFVLQDLRALTETHPGERLTEQAAGLGILFEIPAQDGGVMRVTRFDKKSRTVEMYVGVPASLSAADTTTYFTATLTTALSQAESYLAKRKLDLDLGQAQAAVARALANLPERPLPEEERYRQIDHAPVPDRPIRSLVELDGAGRDLRRIDVYADGRIDYAVRAIETGETQLDRRPVSERPSESRGEKVPEATFDELWAQAIGQPEPRGSIRVVESDG